MEIADGPIGQEATRCGFVAIIGAPNAGKSTLTNQLVGAKVAIVTHKAQTTRTTIRGIAMAGAAQIIIVDTPGIFRPKRRLDRAMVDAAWGGARDADRIVVLLDAARGLDESAEQLIEAAARTGQPLTLVLNKIDKVDKPALLGLAQAIAPRATFDAVFMIAAVNGDGVADLKMHLAQALPAGPWLYPEDQLSEAPLRSLAAEITREKLFLRLHDELPYSSTVETTDWKTLRDGSARIEQTIFVERESQRKILLGKAGATIKAIGAAARHDIEDAMDGKAHLFLFVKVRENWADDPERYREMGLDFPR